MARPITLAGSVFIFMSFSSALCLAVQSDTDPVFPKTLEGALFDSSTQLGRVIPPRTTHQQQRRGAPVKQPLNSVLVNQNGRRDQPKADYRVPTPSASGATKFSAAPGEVATGTIESEQTGHQGKLDSDTQTVGRANVGSTNQQSLPGTSESTSDCRGKFGGV